MKRALIFTLQWSDNYGTLLQAYALQTALKRLGINAAIAPIKPRGQGGIRRCVGRSVRQTYSKLRGLFVAHLRAPVFAGFRSKYFDYSDLSDLYFDQVPGHDFSSFDALVYGSDNIWGAARRVDPVDAEVFFALHVDHPNKISYAASSGGNLLEDPVRDEVINYIKCGNFKSISCRESTSVAVLRDAGVPAIKVPDPTLLLDQDDWFKIEEPAEGCGASIFGYDMGHPSSVSVAGLCHAVADAGDVVRVLYPNDWLKNRKIGVCLTPAQWLYAVHHAKCVVVNSFHGVAFAIIFHRPFVYLPIEGSFARYNGRAFELLSICGLENRILHKGCDVKALAKDPIEWNGVDCRIAAFREIGLRYLRENV